MSTFDPYDPIATAQAASRRLYPSAYEPYGIPATAVPTPGNLPAIPAIPAPDAAGVPAGPTAPATAAPSSGQPKYKDFLLSREQQAGRKLTPEEVMTAREFFKNTVFGPGLVAAGVKSHQMEILSAAFDAKADVADQEYLTAAEAAAIAGGGENSEFIEQAKEKAAAAFGGLVNYGGGLLNLADYGVRGIRGLSELAGADINEVGPGGLTLGQVFNRGFGDKTFLGEMGDAATSASRDFSQQHRTDTTIAQDAEYEAKARALADDPNSTFLDALELYGTSGLSRVSRDLMGVGGEFAGGAGLVTVGRKALLQLPKATQKLAALGTIGAGGTGRGTAEWERQSLERPISEFGPEVQEAARQMVSQLGMKPEDAERAAKQTAVNQGIPFVLAANAAANIALPALVPGLGRAEMLGLRMGVPGSVGRRMVGAGAEEAGEEGLAGLIQTGGENLATNAATGSNIPVFRGAARNVAEGMIGGGLFGTAIGGMPQPNPQATPSTPPTATLPTGPAPTPGVTVAPPTTPLPTGPAPTPGVTIPPTAAPVAPTPVPGAGPVYAGGPGVEESAFNTARQKITEGLATKLAPRTSAFRKAVSSMKADEVIAAAEAQAAALAGDQWQQMSSIQKLDAVEAAVEALNKVAKVKGDDLPNQLATRRDMINQATNPPVTVTPAPIPDIDTPAPAPAPTPAPVGNKLKRGGKSAAATPAPTVDPNDPQFDTLTPGDKLSAAEEMVKAWNAANPKAPITIGTAVQRLSDPAFTKGKTVSALTAEVGAAPKATGLRKKKPVPAPPAAAPAAPTPAPATPIAAPAAPAPTPAPAPVATGPESVIDAVNRILKTNNLTPASMSAVIDAVNDSRKAGNSAPLMAALKTVPNVKSDQLTELLGLTQKPKKAVPAPPKEEPKKGKGLKKAVPKPPKEESKAETPKEEPKKAGIRKKKEVPPAPPKEAPAAKADGKLPDDLRGAKPRYGYGAKQFTLDFDNDIDKALYIIAGETSKSKADPRYMEFVKAELGISEAEARFEGQQVRARIKELAKGAKAGALKVPSGVAPSPKPQAPAGAGAEGRSAKPVNKTETTHDAVRRIMQDELEESEVDELAAAIKLGRESGDPGPISAAIKDLEELGAEFSADQKRMLRELATPQVDRAPVVENPPQSIESDSLSDEPASPTEIDANIRELRIELVQQLKPLPEAERAVAMLQILAKSKYSTRHQKWLAKKLIPVVRKVKTAVQIKSPSTTEHGKYSPSKNLVTIYTVRPSTILHEFLHAVTAHAMNGLLPNSGGLKQKWEALQRHAVKYLNDNKSVLTDYTKNLTERQSDRIFAALEKKEELLTYALTDYTVRGLFVRIPSTTSKHNNLWQEFKNLLVDFYAKAFNADISQRTFLDDILEFAAYTVEVTDADANAIAGNLADTASVQDTLNALLVSSQLDDLLDTNNGTLPAVRVTPVQWGQRLWELFSVASLGIEKAEQDLRASGGNVTAENSVYYAMRKYTSDMAEMKAVDNLEVVEPVKNWIHANWRKFGSTTAKEFRTDLDKFLQNFHMLRERNPTIWAETVKLPPDAELERAELIDDAYAGKITGKQLSERLITLANQKAVVGLEEWSETTKLGKSNKAMRKTLAELKAKGFDENSLADLNTLVQQIRDRSFARNVEAGIVDSNDPFATRGWEWYVPLKEHLSISPEAADYDIGSVKGEAKSFRDTRLKTMKGRQSNAANALTTLVEDMNNAATAAARGFFTSKAFELVTDPANQKLLGAKVIRYFGTPKSGYYAIVKKVNKKTGKVTYGPGTVHAELRIKDNSGGFIYHNGNEHYVVYLPKEGQLNRGITGLERVLTPTVLKEGALLEKPLKAVGTVTNIMARAYTTWHPVWQLMVGFLRDTSTLPSTVAVTVFDSPLKAAGFAKDYMANLAVNTAQLSKLDKTWASVIGNKAKLKKYVEDRAAANLPDDLFVKIYKYREAGGSTEFAQGLNRDRADDLLFGRLEPTAFNMAAKGYDKWNDITSNWAALLENVGRVAAWEALVQQGKTPYEAAVIAKSALDYGQSGEWGRLINLWHAFFRVGATSLDTIRRAFTTPTGEVDAPKVMKWTPFFAAMGAVAYLFQAMLLGDDEDGEERIKKIDANTLTQRVVFPGMDGDTNSYPIGLGLPQLLMAPGILGTALATGHISGEEASEAYYNVLLRSSPVQPTGLKKDARGPVGFGMSWVKGMLMGTPVRPGLEIDYNTNAFGNTVHTEWVDKTKDKADQGMPSTGQEWKEIASFMRDLGIDMYPEDYAHLARGYGGQLATEVVRWTIDKERKEMEGAESSAIRTSLRLGVTDEEFYYRNEARDIKEQLNVSLRRLNAAVEDGARESSWLSQNPRDKRRIAEWRILDKAQDRYYEEIAKIRANKLLSDEGRRLQKKRADSRLREAVNRAQRVIDATAN